MKISGSGTVGSNYYNEEIHISGSCTLEGNIKCKGIHASGTVNGTGRIESSGETKISGSGHISGELVTNTLNVSGSFSSNKLEVNDTAKISGTSRISGDMYALMLRASGSVYVGGSLKCADAEISGSLECTGDVNSERLSVSGHVDIKGLLNSEYTNIRLGHRIYRNSINSIGGTTVEIERYDDSVSPFSVFHKDRFSKIVVVDCIEGDEIYLENTECPLVVGKNVTVGEGCVIGKVQYSGTYNTKGDADVGAVERI